MCHVGSECAGNLHGLKEASALSFPISFHPPRALRKGQTVAVGTILQTDCQNPPPFAINLMLTFLMLVDAINGRRESVGLIFYVLFQAMHIGLLNHCRPSSAIN